MSQIWKFPFAIQDEFILVMPRMSTIVRVEVQGETPCIWAIVHPNEPKVKRIFFVRGTGHDLPENSAYVATVQMTPYVWHLLERKP